MKIKHKLIAAFLAVVLIPIIAIIFVNQSAMDEAITHDYQVKGQSDLENFTHFALPKLADATVNYINFMALDSNIIKASYYANTLNTADDIKTALAKFQQQLGLSFIEITDESGKVTFSSIESRAGTRLSNALISNAESDTKQVEFVIDPGFNQYTITTAATILRKGKSIGLIHGGYVLDEGLLNEVTDGKEVMLLDEKGKNITSTGTVASTLEFTRQAFNDTVSACRSDVNNEACKEPEFGFYRSHVNGIPYIFSSRPVSLSSGVPQASIVMAQNAQEMEDKLSAARNTIIFIGFLFISIACAVGFFVTKTIVDPLERVKNMIRDIAEGEGDLTQRIKTSANDEIGELATWFNRFVDNLQNMVRDIGNIAKPLASSAEEMANIAANTGENIGFQQSSVSTVAAAMNEMVATVQETANSALHVSDSTGDADRQVGKGREVVTTTITSIEALASGVERSAEVIQKVNHDTASMATVLDVIKGVAEQTNLLALNAAIEAARAGEQGRGFAVVADEVRTLAQRTQESTAEIQAIIEHLQRGVADAVSAMEQGKDQATRSVEQAQVANEAFTEISNAVASVADMVSQIASAAEQQTAVAEGINEDVTKISQAANQTAEGATQTTCCSEQLSDYATKLQSTVNRFKV